MVGGKQLKYLSKSGSKLSRETGLLWGSEAFNSSPEVHIYLELGHQLMPVPWTWWTLLYFFKYSTLDKFISNFTVAFHGLTNE